MMRALAVAHLILLQGCSVLLDRPGESDAVSAEWGYSILANDGLGVGDILRQGDELVARAAPHITGFADVVAVAEITVDIYPGGRYRGLYAFDGRPWLMVVPLADGSVDLEREAFLHELLHMWEHYHLDVGRQAYNDLPADQHFASAFGPCVEDPDACGW